MENASQGVALILTGLVTVLVILVMIALSVEAIILFDGWMRKRAGRRKAVVSGEEAEVKVPPEVIAAIGLGLHQFLLEEEAKEMRMSIDRKRSTFWAGSGRMEIMNGRREVILRRR